MYGKTKNIRHIGIVIILVFAVMWYHAPQEIFAEESQAPPASESSPSPPPSESSQPSETTIATGNATSELTAQNGVNSNTVEDGAGSGASEAEASGGPPQTGSQSEMPPATNATSTLPLSDADSPPQTETAPPSETPPQATSTTEELPLQSSENGNREGATLVNANENSAEGENAASSSATTGENIIGQSGGESALILTGNAHAVANIMNVVNTSIVDSQGWTLLLNLFSQFFGEINLSGLAFDFSSLGNGCPPGCGAFSDLSVANENYATIVNDVSVIAETGSNIIHATTTRSVIATGNAFASANVVNVANTNIIGSNYLLFVLNNFDGWVGDLVFPGKAFFEGLFSSSGFFPTELEVTNENSATIENVVDVTASSGANDTSGTSGGVIVTGDATAASNVVTVANTNITGNDSLFILVRVFGHWTGNIYSTPPGIFWQQRGDGIVLHAPDGGTILDNRGENASSCCETSLAAGNINNAAIRNRLQVFALTGENEITASGGESTIVTGRAAAVTNVFNLVNTNIVGRNWLLALVNIFGDWSGNLSFGKPNLWVGQQVETSGDPLVGGSPVGYTIHVVNRGNADATQVEVEAGGNPLGRVAISEGGGGTVEGGVVHWALSSIPAGGSATFTYSARVSDDLPVGITSFVNTARAQSYEPDADMNDNNDSLTLALLGRSLPGSGGGTRPDLSLKKTHNKADVLASPTSTVEYKIVVKNDGPGPAFGVLVRDVLYDPVGTVVATSSWDLGIVEAGEKVVIEYEAEFGPDARTGHYINYAFLSIDGYHHYNGTFPYSPASTDVYLINPDDLGGSGGSTGGTIETASLERFSETPPPDLVSPPPSPSEIAEEVEKALSPSFLPVVPTAEAQGLAGPSLERPTLLASLVASMLSGWYLFLFILLGLGAAFLSRIGRL